MSKQLCIVHQTCGDGPCPACVAEERCPECKVTPPGHKIGCKTGNERARKYQQGLARKHRRRKRGATRFPLDR